MQKAAAAAVVVMAPDEMSKQAIKLALRRYVRARPLG